MRDAVRRNDRECAGAFAHYFGIRRMNPSKRPAGFSADGRKVRTCPN
jgi:hypothetical protein